MIVTATPDSSFISAVGYDAKTEVLVVQIGNRVYTYVDVPRHVFYRLRNHETKGRYYSKRIKGHYETMPRQTLSRTARKAA